MAIIVFQHESFEDSAQLGAFLQQQGHRLRTIHLYHGEEVPVDFDDVDGVISMGGTMNVDDTDEHAWLKPELAYLKQAHEKGLPIVGVCLGHQLIAKALGGEVAAMEKPEIGFGNVKLAFPGTIDTLHAGIAWDSVQFHFHGQEVSKLPEGGTPLSGSKACRTQAFKVGMKTFGFQYHFEWTLEDIKKFLALPWVKENGYSPDQILDDAGKFYENYRRRGDRLCENIATYLFPIDKL